MTTSKIANHAINVFICFEIWFIICISVIAIIYVMASLIVMFNQIERLANVSILPVQLLSSVESMYVDHHKIE
jgi:hypothetical protein